MKKLAVLMMGLTLIASADDFSRDLNLEKFTPPPGYQCRPIDNKPRKPRKRRKPKPAPAPVVIEKEKVVEKVVTVEKEVAPLYKNRLSLVAGMGPYMGGTLDKLPFKVSLGIDYLPMAGVGYDRRLDFISPRLSGRVLFFTNLSWAVGAGWDF